MVSTLPGLTDSSGKRYQLEANWMQLSLFKREREIRELGWLNSELGFSKGCKVTILPIFHFFDFIACKAAQEGYTVTDLPR